VLAISHFLRPRSGSIGLDFERSGPIFLDRVPIFLDRVPIFRSSVLRSQLTARSFERARPRFED
jgi:hypothetical protein